MRTIDVFYAFPSVLLAIAISGALGAGIFNSLVSLTIVFIPPIVRVCRKRHHAACAISISSMPRAHPGQGRSPSCACMCSGNVLGPIFVYATSLISVCMILAAGLSFLGLGTKPPEPEWGLMLNTLRTAIYVNPCGRGLARRDDLHRLDLFQSVERRPAECDGCQKLKRSRRRATSAARRSRSCRCKTSSSISVSAAACSARKSVVRAVDDVSITVDKGEVVGIVGESGCGKSTTARLIIGLIEPDEGNILFDGEAVGSDHVDCANCAAACRWCFRTAMPRSIRG